MTKKKVFVRYDFDNDKGLYDLIIGNAKLEYSSFEDADHSLKEAAPASPDAAPCPRQRAEFAQRGSHIE